MSKTDVKEMESDAALLAIELARGIRGREVECPELVRYLDCQGCGKKD